MIEQGTADTKEYHVKESNIEREGVTVKVRYTLYNRSTWYSI